MAGHSKWANIKHRKGAQDARRSKIFTRIIKELAVASKEGGEDQDSNPRLRTAIQNAKGANMPKDTITRAIKKGSGNNSVSYEEVTFEGYAPNGIAIFIECTTDNNNRTVANIRSIFNKYGGSLGVNGSLEFIFERKGVFVISEKEMLTEIDDFEMGLIDSGLESLEKNNDLILVYTDFANFNVLQKRLEELDVSVKSAELQRIPNGTKKLNLFDAKKVLRMLDKFEEDDDVQNVFHNLEMTEDLEKELKLQ